jgi:hypothetical protein
MHGGAAVVVGRALSPQVLEGRAQAQGLYSPLRNTFVDQVLRDAEKMRAQDPGAASAPVLPPVGAVHVAGDGDELGLAATRAGGGERRGVRAAGSRRLSPPSPASAQTLAVQMEPLTRRCEVPAASPMRGPRAALVRVKETATDEFAPIPRDDSRTAADAVGDVVRLVPASSHRAGPLAPSAAPPLPRPLRTIPRASPRPRPIPRPRRCPLRPAASCPTPSPARRPPPRPRSLQTSRFAPQPCASHPRKPPCHCPRAPPWVRRALPAAGAAAPPPSPPPAPGCSSNRPPCAARESWSLPRPPRARERTTCPCRGCGPRPGDPRRRTSSRRRAFGSCAGKALCFPHATGIRRAGRLLRPLRQTMNTGP